MTNFNKEIPFDDYGGKSFRLPHADFYLGGFDRFFSSRKLDAEAKFDHAREIYRKVISILVNLGLTDDKEYQHLSYIKFDLTKPIDYQLTIAKGQLATDAETYRISAPQSRKLFGKTRDNWPRHLRVIDAKDQGATHEEIYEQFVEEWSGGDEDMKDDFYRPIKTEKLKDQDSLPKATVSQWHKQAVGVMEKAARLL